MIRFESQPLDLDTPWTSQGCLNVLPKHAALLTQTRGYPDFLKVLCAFIAVQTEETGGMMVTVRAYCEPPGPVDTLVSMSSSEARKILK